MYSISVVVSVECGALVVRVQAAHLNVIGTPSHYIPVFSVLEWKVTFVPMIMSN